MRVTPSKGEGSVASRQTSYFTVAMAECLILFPYRTRNIHSLSRQYTPLTDSAAPRPRPIPVKTLLQATIRSPAGKRELVRRAAALQREWKAAVATIYHETARGPQQLAVTPPASATGETPPRDLLGLAGKTELNDASASHPTERIDFSPILRLVWDVHSGDRWPLVVTTGKVIVARGGEVEPSELKYVGASLRSLFGAKIKVITQTYRQKYIEVHTTKSMYTYHQTL